MSQFNFHTRKFANCYPPTAQRKFGTVIQWLWNRKPKPWPQEVPLTAQQVCTMPLQADQIRATFINHATVLIQTAEVNILTDPIWSKRCSPFSWLGPKRVAAPGINFNDLPPIHAVLITHNHYDHLDLPTLKQLQEVHQPHFFISWGNGKLLRKLGIKAVTELAWWDQVPFQQELIFHFVPAQHFSRRGLFDENKTLWGGFVIERAQGGVIYFAGDTGYGTHFRLIAEKFGSPALAFLPIGAYAPRWIMEPIHMSPKEAVKAHLELNAKQSMGIHFGTFPLADEGIEDPITELKKWCQVEQIKAESFVALKNGHFLTCA